MVEEIKKIISEIDEDIKIIFDLGYVCLTKEVWDDVIEFRSDNIEELKNKIVKWSELYQEINKIIEKVDKRITIWTNGDEVILTHNDWSNDIVFPLGDYQEDDYDNDKLLAEIYNFLELKYIPVKACYTEDYFEVLVNLPEIFWGDGLSGVYISSENDDDFVKDKIHYEISCISETFANLIELKQNYRHIEVVGNFTTLKVYNINKVLNVKIEEPNFEEQLFYIAKCILFELSSKHSLALNIYDLPKYDEEDYEFEYDLFEVADTLNKTQAPFIKKYYDSDLIDYYHRASIMAESEFKYLAYYQVLECIFDEIYRHETVQDVKQIMNSSWFSSYNDEHVTKIIEIVERYNKNKNDREKLKLVLEKYFKGEIHEQAFIIANKDIIDILKNKMKMISRDSEINDLQKLANILYDFRCNCTHSNRTYPFRTTFEQTSDELSLYIELLRKVVERVIINYPPKRVI